MSRLDSAIRRLEAQRACLDWATRAAPAGAVLELGLGNGRTYDHLRERLPGRAIYVFDRQVAAHPDCVPDDDHLFLGDFRETLPRAAVRLGRVAALAHADIGTGDPDASRALGRAIAPLVVPLLVPGALLLSDQPLDGYAALPLPEGVPRGRYHAYRYAGA